MNSLFLAVLLFSQSSLGWVWLKSNTGQRIRVDSKPAIENPKQASRIDWKVYNSTIQSSRPKSGVFPFFMEGEDQGGVPFSWACTAFLVKSWPGNQVPKDSPAYILTNGHCLDDLEKPKRFILKSKGFIGKFSKDLILRAENVEWQVVTPNGRGSDLAVLSLNAKAKDLLDEGYEFYYIVPFESVRVGATLTQYAWRTIFTDDSAFFEYTEATGPITALPQEFTTLDGTEKFTMVKPITHEVSFVPTQSGSPMFLGDKVACLGTTYGETANMRKPACSGDPKCRRFEIYNACLSPAFIMECFSGTGVFNRSCADRKHAELLKTPQ
jgi:hypothetical protein